MHLIRMKTLISVVKSCGISDSSSIMSLSEWSVSDNTTSTDDSPISNKLQSDLLSCAPDGNAQVIVGNRCVTDTDEVVPILIGTFPAHRCQADDCANNPTGNDIKRTSNLKSINFVDAIPISHNIKSKNVSARKIRKLVNNKDVFEFFKLRVYQTLSREVKPLLYIMGEDAKL